MQADGPLDPIEEIRLLKARYFRCVDTKDWDGFAAVFAPEAVVDFSRALDVEPGVPHPLLGGKDGRVFNGRDEIRTKIPERMQRVRTVHHGYMPEISLESATTAKGIWAMEDIHRWTDARGAWALHGHGHYHESYRKIDGGFVITDLKLTRLLLDVQVVQHP